MNIKLPPPPQWSTQKLIWDEWYRILWRFVRSEVNTSGDEAATISSGTTYHGVTALTAGRTLTLPSAADMQDGDTIVVQDESGAAGTHNITIQRAGTDTVNGGASVAISSNYGRMTIIKNGTGTFFAA